MLDFEDELTALGFTGQTSEIFPQENLQVKYLILMPVYYIMEAPMAIIIFIFGASMYHINRLKKLSRVVNFI
jgi:hypothetical protein